MARNSIGEEVANRVVKEQTGSARNFRAIDGVGDKTAQAVKGVPGIRGPSDAAEKTADELAEEAGISQSRAEKVIRGGGGDPDRKPRSNTSSVSAAGIKLSHGEFKTEVSAHDAVEAKFETSLNRGIGRSQEAARADKAKRAPITTDKERWKDNKGELDFPGVDTPTADPQVLPKDLRQEQRPNTTAPDEATVSDDRAARQSVDASAPGNDGFLLEDQVEAGVDDDELNRGVLFGAQAEQGADVSLTPDEGFVGRFSESQSSFAGGPAYNSKAGSVVETDRLDQEQRPPEQALQEQQQAGSGGSGGGVSLDNSDRETIRAVERSAVASGREPSVLEELRFSDQPTEEQREVFGEVAGSLLSGREAIEDNSRTDTEFFDSETLEDVSDLKDRLGRA